MGNTIVYKVENNLYINLTNRCTNACTFCIRTNCKDAYGHDLWLDKEPSVKEIIDAAGELERYSEIIFCGYGEPTIKLNELIETGRYFKNSGKKVRLNTNGQGNIINNKNIVPMLKDSLTSVSISLNAPTAEKYQELCKCEFNDKVFENIIEFAKLSKEYFETTLTVLDLLDKDDTEKCREIAQGINVNFRVRTLI